MQPAIATAVGPQTNKPEKPPASDFARQARAEWDEFFAHPVRAHDFADAAANINVRRVLDVGCGGGQELLPFIKRGSTTVGIDISREVGEVAVALHSTLGLPHIPAFICGLGEHLPFHDGAFDVVICRLALPYMWNGLALAEMLRVLHIGGALIVQIHALRYYAEQLISSLLQRNSSKTKHAARVIIAGAAYHLSGRQSQCLIKETFQSPGQLRREVKKAGGSVQHRLPIANRRAPAYLITKP